MNTANLNAWCKICNNEKVCDEVIYVYSPTQNGEMIKLGTKVCPGCDGTGISIRAKQWREDNMEVC